MNTCRQKNVWVLVFVLFIAFNTSHAQTDTPRTTLVLGHIAPDDPADKIEEFQPIIDYLAENLGDFGIERGEVKIAPDLETLMEWVKEGEVDIFYDSLYPALIISAESEAEPLLRGWRDGEPVYHSVFFARKDSDIKTLDDFKGNIIALDELISTSGYMMPISHLIANDLTPVEVESFEDSVSDDEVGYVFSGDDSNTIAWVLGERVNIGVVDNLTYMQEIPAATRAELVIVAETAEVPRRVVMVGADLDPELVEALKELMMGLDETQEGLALLKILETKEFDEFPGGTKAAFTKIQEFYEIVAAE